MSVAELEKAGKALTQGKVGLCEQICQQVLSKNPASQQALDLLSRSAAMRRDFPRAVLFAARLLALANGQVRLQSRLHARIAGYQKMSGSLEEAEKNYRAAISADPDYPTHTALFLTFLYDHARFNEARELAPRLLKQLSVPVADISEEDYRPIAPALYLVAQLVETADLEDYLAALRALEAGADHAALRADASFYFAEASLLDRLKQYPEALHYFLEANRMRRLESGYDVDPVLRQIQNISDLFGPEFFAIPAEAEVAAGDPRVIFIVGMPRSGTSLVEQVYAAHSDVTAVGESESLARSVAAEFKQRPDCNPAKPESFDAAFFADIRKKYLRGVGFKPGQKIITDKMPANLMYAWAIRKAFPDAKIVVCEREKTATVMSCFATNFANRNCFSESIEDCARYYDKMYESADRWNERIGDRVLQQSYEDLVNHPREQIGRLLDHAGLAHEEPCFTPHESKRVVPTASRLQVTQPIYRTGNERWEPYLPHLGDVAQLLA